jgi:hypothetical protein
VKLGNFIAAILILGCAYAIYLKLPVAWTQGGAAAPAPAGTASSTGEVTAPAPGMTSLFSRIASLLPHTPTAAERLEAQRRQMVNDPRWRFWGIAIDQFNGQTQDLDGPMLLVRGVIAPEAGSSSTEPQIFTLFDFPAPERVPKGSVVKGLACAAGTAKSPQGEVHAYFYTDHEAFDQLQRYDHFGKPVNRDPNGTIIANPGGSYQNPLEKPAQQIFPVR